jgi:hypothetical protein
MRNTAMNTHEILNEETQYEELRKLGQRLHVPIPEAYWECEVRDRNGKIIQRLRQHSHSWVRNAYNAMFCQLAGKDASDTTFGAGKISGKDTGGTVRTLSRALGTDYNSSCDGLTPGSGHGYRGSAASDTTGIVVGSGTAPESFEDYALQTLISNGTGAGQLSYVASEAHAVSYDAMARVLRNSLARFFNNNSGGDVNVNEVGIIFYTQYNGYRYLYSRDKLATTVTVPNTGQLKVTYTVQLTYPA